MSICKTRHRAASALPAMMGAVESSFFVEEEAICRLYVIGRRAEQHPSRLLTFIGADLQGGKLRLCKT
jgi:hypothetical protein